MQKKKDNKKFTIIKSCVLIAEPFGANFSNANIFLTINNCPAIQYTLHWLAEGGIEDVFLFYTNPQIQQYFKSHKISELRVRLQFVKAGEFKSIGDALRQLQFRNLVSQDFLLLFGDTLTNLPLQNFVNHHFQKKNELKNVSITAVLKPQRGKYMHVLNSQTKQILQIQLNNKQQFVLYRQRINLKKVSIQIRRDLSFADIYICTIQALKIFKQIFQYQTMSDYINGSLISQVNDDRINTYICDKNQMVFRMSYAVDYYLCYMHLITRHLYPYTIENTCTLPRTRNIEYTITQYNKIFKKNSKIEHNTLISNNAYIGQESKVGKNCQINKSIICQDCIIKQNTTLKNCIIVKNCVLSQNSKYQYCLIEKVNQMIKIHSFKDVLFDSDSQLMERQIFIETPDNQQLTFEQQMKNLLTEDPDQQLVKDLYSTRKQHNLTLEQFVKEMIKISAPNGPKGVLNYVQKWGQTIINMHASEKQAIQSIYYSCLNQQKYIKAFHVFLQYFYGNELLSSDSILSWYKSKDQQTQTLKLCQKFIASLQEDESEEDN